MECSFYDKWHNSNYKYVYAICHIILPMSSVTRNKMVLGAADLLSRRGMHATSLREVVRHTATPRGSIGYHFPGGKAQLITEAVQLAQRDVSVAVEEILRLHGSVAGIRRVFSLRAKLLEDSQYEAGCPVLVVAVERYTDDARQASDSDTQQQLLGVAHAAFADWQGLFAAALERDGVPTARARRLAALTLSAMEGSVALCRAALNLQAINDVAIEMEDLVRTAIAQSQPT